MGHWVVENSTGEVKDYSDDGAIQYDPRFFTTRQTMDKPSGDSPGQYQWDGVKIVKRPPPTPSGLTVALDAALAAATPTLAQIKAVFQEWRKDVA